MTRKVFNIFKKNVLMNNIHTELISLYHNDKCDILNYYGVRGVKINGEYIIFTCEMYFSGKWNVVNISLHYKEIRKLRWCLTEKRYVNTSIIK